jgi:hypothetical protein
MILDNDLILSSAQAITDDAYSSNVWDRGAAGATGKDLWLVFRVHTAFVSAGGATLQIEIRTAATLTGADLAAGYTKLLMSRLYAVADLDAADVIVWKVKVPSHEVLRYVQAYYEVATSTFSAGKMDCFVVDAVEKRP